MGCHIALKSHGHLMDFKLGLLPLLLLYFLFRIAVCVCQV